MKKTVLKALLLSFIIAMCSVMPLHAQTDGFFRGGNDNYENRGQINSNTENGITNNGIGQNEGPLGSGLLIMVAAGAGYAIARRRRTNCPKAPNASKAIIMALALLLGMTQCKKKVETITEASTGMHITLTVDDDSKVNVYPYGAATYAPVDYEKNDVIYVGNGAEYIGSLTYTDNGYFEGNIDNTKLPQADDYLYFYFLGNKTPYETVAVGATSLSVNIIDQTSEYPVISYAPSKETFSEGNGKYTARLLNYCSIQKFTSNVNKVIKLKGMKNKVTLDFTKTSTPYYYGYVDSEGAILLHRESDYDGTGSYESWAIVLPQEAITAATASAVGYGTSSSFGVHQIDRNGYYNEAININMVVTGYVDGIVSVSPTQKVYCSSGNLQYQASTNTWRFAENQWDCVGADNANISSTYNGWIDLFGWGTSGWDNTANDQLATNYQPWSSGTTIYCDDYDPDNVNNYNPTHYGPTWTGANNPGSNDITNTNWDWGVYHTSGIDGVPQITNSGGNKFRISTENEGYYFAGFTSESYGIRVKEFGTGNWQPLIGWGEVNGVKGFILLPDNWDGSIDPNFVYNASPWRNVYNENKSPKWSAMEAYGVSFAPAAGYREGTNVYEVNSHVYFWCSEGQLFEDDFQGQHNHYAYNNLKRANYLEILGENPFANFLATSRYRYHGLSVRLWHYID